MEEEKSCRSFTLNHTETTDCWVLQKLSGKFFWNFEHATATSKKSQRFTGNSESVVTFRPESHELTSSRPCWAVLSSVYPPFVSLLRSHSHFICRLLHCITNEKGSPGDKPAHVEPKRRVCWAARRAGVGAAAAGSSLSPWLLFVWPKLRASRTNDPLGFTESIWPAAGCTEASPTF